MSLFYCLETDKSRRDVALENQFAGPTPSACWLVGGGPSLATLPIEKIAASPIPKMTLNLAGSKLLRPTFWTSYDPTERFHKSIYLDPSVMKFVHRRRAMEMVPETNFKVCESPNTYLFDRDKERGYANFLSPTNTNIVDWADSMVQAIDILYRLGFRKLYLAGCEMHVAPSAEQIQAAKKAGVIWQPQMFLKDFLKECNAHGLSAKKLDRLAPSNLYHFDEHKAIKTASHTEQHYFRVAQYLRLARKSMATAGMQLISVTPHSRLNDYFPYLPAAEIIKQIAENIGNPSEEKTEGLYRQTESRTSSSLFPLEDFPPHNWSKKKTDHKEKQPPQKHSVKNQQDGELLIEEEGYVFA
ncbi:hypothetical protein MNBD_PLANCTO02-2050 [hydrothermal vent metagenome]|uniref:Uncharacterized protein n=1 Tax=hydrothermal vent metagenome TaxID=652676 RepID=A0A3B1DCP0_9ZZZZ